LESNNSSPPPDRDTLTKPEWGGSIFNTSNTSTTSKKSRALRSIGARSGVDYIGKRGNDASCGK